MDRNLLIMAVILVTIKETKVADVKGLPYIINTIFKVLYRKGGYMEILTQPMKGLTDTLIFIIKFQCVLLLPTITSMEGNLLCLFITRSFGINL
jgi:hypothetical protein